MFQRIKSSPLFRRGHALIRGEWAVLALLAISSGLVYGFVRLADEVVEGETATFDNGVLQLFRNPADPNDVIGPLWVEEMVRDITSLGSYALLILISLSVVIYLLLARMRAAALLVLVSVVGGMILSTALKIGFDRPRPDLTVMSHQFTSSFPSGHSLLSAVTFLTLGTLLAQLAPTRSQRVFAILAAVVLTLMVGLSRIYMGVHFPTDVLAGWSLGAAWALLCGAIGHLLQRRGAVEEPGEITETRER